MGGDPIAGLLLHIWGRLWATVIWGIPISEKGLFSIYYGISFLAEPSWLPLRKLFGDAFVFWKLDRYFITVVLASLFKLYCIAVFTF